MAESHSSAPTTPPPSSANREASPSEENAANGSQTRLRSPESRRVSITFGRTSWSYGDESAIVRDDTWSCIAVVFSFWFFVSVTLILGVYGSMVIMLGPESSIVLQPSPVFVQYVKVENLDEKPGPILYGTYQYPPLDVVTTWGETRNVSLPSGLHKEWKYYLNRGSEVNISYSLSSESSSIFLVIAEGAESLSLWLEDPTYPNTTLSWNMIHGTGMITQEIFFSSSYYVAVGNLDEEVENTSNDEWYVKVSYGPRWVTYIFGIGGMTLLMFWAFKFLNKLQRGREDRAEVGHDGTASQRAPLLSRKEDDLSSWGSSYDSLPEDEEDLDLLAGGSIDGKLSGDGETSNNTRRLCAICFDAPRDCFFLPCGHCAACFACGTTIAEAAGTCPVCRRNMKKLMVPAGEGRIGHCRKT
ncbi:Zinc finger, RING-type [Sesbania bispinosa]|nr:Zinc finger, RING-type [Sesbania bispinosa]